MSYTFNIHLGGELRAISHNASKRHINSVFRHYDQSQLWPIRGRFNATERAIRALRRAGLYMGTDYDPQAYALDLENAISVIVSNQI